MKLLFLIPRSSTSPTMAYAPMGTLQGLGRQSKEDVFGKSAASGKPRAMELCGPDVSSPWERLFFEQEGQGTPLLPYMCMVTIPSSNVCDHCSIPKRMATSVPGKEKKKSHHHNI